MCKKSLPFGWCIDVSEELFTARVDFGDGHAHDDIPNFSRPIIDRLLPNREAAAMVGGAQRVKTSIVTGRNYTIGSRRLGHTQYLEEQLTSHSRHIDRYDQVPLIAAPQGRQDAPRRSDIWNVIKHMGHPRQQRRTADDGDRVADGRQLSRVAFEETPAIETELSLVDTHPSASPSCEEKAGGPHGRIVPPSGTAALGRSRKHVLEFTRFADILFWNKCVQECFKLATLVVVAAAVSSAAVMASSVQKPTSVVRVDPRTGRLVRKIVVPVPSASTPAVLSKPAATPASPQLQEVVEQTAKRYELDPLLVHSVIQVESNYNQFALSSKGAQGLMQLIPSTARRFGVSNPWDVQQNVEGGVRYLKYLAGLFPNDLQLTIAAYNAGEAAVMKHGNTVPPYRETLDYVNKVGARYGKARLAAGKRQVDAKPTSVELAEVPTAPRYAPIEHYLDSSGRLHIRTLPAPETRNP